MKIYIAGNGICHREAQGDLKLRQMIDNRLYSFYYVGLLGKDDFSAAFQKTLDINRQQ